MTDTDGAREDARPAVSTAVVSPYAGGGGGSTLGHRVATSYLADMLLGHGRAETDELPVVGVSFQTNPTDPIDDLRIEAADDDARAIVHIAARRSPKFVESHQKTAKLVESLLDQVELFGEDERKYVAVAVAGMTPALRQVQGLASLARDNASERAFYGQVHEPRRHAGYAGRYKSLTALVQKARPAAPSNQVRNLVWSLLRRLWILNFRVESDDETDWTSIGNRLIPLARTGVGGGEVRNHLYALAAQFDQQGTEVDRGLLRRSARSVLAPEAGRSSSAWRQLENEQSAALIAVRHSLAGGLELPRTELRVAIEREFTKAGRAASAVVITGESGTGKSALTLSTAHSLASTSDEFEYVALNLRRLPETVSKLSSDLGMPLRDVLCEMTAASRVLILDAADVADEERFALLRGLAAEARAASLGLILVTADTAVEDVAATISDLYPSVERLEIGGLTDDELRVVSSAVPAISGTLKNAPATSMYRRLAVVDLLARTGVEVTEPLSNWNCLQLIWRKLISRPTLGSSAAARTETLLAISEEELDLPVAERRSRVEYGALDALRADRLVSPEDLRKPQPTFAHDEVRRFAAAVRLVRASSMVQALEQSGPKRWSMSAAKLACEGLLTEANDANGLAALVAQFDSLGAKSSVRWRDVPFEAVLEMPNAYELLRQMIDANPSRRDAVLATLVKVVSLHQRHNGMVDVLRGEPVVRLLLDGSQPPWDRNDEAFRLLCEWLNSALLMKLLAGQPFRQQLRERLLVRWREYRSSATDRSSPEESTDHLVHNVFDDYSIPRRRPKHVSREILQERYVRLLALLGPDIDDEVRSCLSEIATRVPSRLSPAVDLGWSALGLSMYDPAFLLQLTEAYFIDDRGDRGTSLWNGIRNHESPGSLQGPNRGPFWLLVKSSPAADWAPVINRILNHAARVRCLADGLSGPRNALHPVTLSIDGVKREYVGDEAVWAWYRGSTGGPYPCVSALQAIEQWIDRSVAVGVSMESLAIDLLNGCENLAMPGLLVGAAIRHFGADPRSLDRYLVEPSVWAFEQYRAAKEGIGFLHPSDEGITNPERRSWQLASLIPFLVLNADDARQQELRDLGAELIENAAHSEVSESRLRRWAASFDANNITTKRVEGGVEVSVKEPEDIEQELAPVRADLERGNLLLSLQNKYWIPPREQKGDWKLPTASEIARDLAQVKELHDDPPRHAGFEPHLALAHIAKEALHLAVTESVEPLNAQMPYAIKSILDILRQAAHDAEGDSSARDYESDIGTRRAAAEALPWLLLPELAISLKAAGANSTDVADAVAALGSSAATETCLSFARGCDLVWSHACSGDVCIHKTAYDWVLDLARYCEAGEFDEDLQEALDAPLDGDVIVQLPHIRPDRLDTSRLSATIRAVGHAAASNACVATAAHEDLDTLLRTQAQAMAELESSELILFVDERGAETQTAARALLLRSAGAGAGLGDELLMDYITIVAPTPHLLSSFLQHLGTAGTESQELADAARLVWPQVFAHALDEVDANAAIYSRPAAFVGHALSELLPNHPETTHTMHGEMGLQTYDWMRPEELTEFIPRWLPYAAGRSACLLELVRFLNQLPIDQQVRHGISWVGDLCLSDPNRRLVSYAPMEEWLVDIKSEAERIGAGVAWLDLVDRLVYEGNTTLAAHSR
ncbi:ATP-binding protein [Microbacterium algeriense]|uniref:ATP-binding protein n=1 Tax=Microbacterium algeriense TaxID=2615184 RepID=UPI0002F02172|nr:ATP-binding protein [Microbacterium barkeri]